LRTGGGGLRGGLRLPGVLANENADPHLANHHRGRGVSGAEVALVVEHAVVRQRLLVRSAFHRAAAQHAGGVVDLALAVRVTDQRGEPVGLAGQVPQRVLAGLQETRPDQQVLRRISAERQLGERHQCRTTGLRLRHQLAHAGRVGGHRTDREIVLGQGQAQRGHGAIGAREKVRHGKSSACTAWQTAPTLSIPQ
jgi:hypothetical protein